jgi:hypothetical protein
MTVRRIRWRRVALLTFALAVLLCALLWPDANSAHAEYRGNSIWLSSGPDSPNGGLMDRYPLDRYRLDVHIDGGLDNIGGNVAQVVATFTSLLWMATSWAVWLAISLFGWAFNLNLLTGPSGALGPVGQAVGAFHTDVLGNPWVIVGLLAAGLWGVWKALGQRRFTEAVTALGFGVALTVAATFLVVQPQQTVGSLSGWTDEISSSFLSANGGRTHVSDQLVESLILAPWTTLEFGGSEHCVRPGWQAGGDAVKPVKPTAPGPKTCRRSDRYAHAFLAEEPGSDRRDGVYKAIEDGGAPYDHADEPAVDTMQQGGAYERFIVTLLVLAASVGAVIVLAGLALGIVLAQIVALFLLAFAPLALVAAPFPPAHRFVQAWFLKLGSALFIKVLYSLALAGVVAVGGALAAATATLGFVLAFGLQAALYWTLFVKRNWIAAHVGLRDTSAAGRMARHPVGAVTGAHDRHVRKQEREEVRVLTRAETDRAEAVTELVRGQIDDQEMNRTREETTTSGAATAEPPRSAGDLQPDFGTAMARRIPPPAGPGDLDPAFSREVARADRERNGHLPVQTPAPPRAFDGPPPRTGVPSREPVPSRGPVLPAPAEPLDPHGPPVAPVPPVPPPAVEPVETPDLSYLTRHEL